MIADEHGLILLGLPGLSQGVLQKALETGATPFLRRLTELERYRLCPLYSGLPSAPPAVEAKVLFGEAPGVPGWAFLERGQVVDLGCARTLPGHQTWSGAVSLGGHTLGQGEFYAGWQDWFARGGRPWARFAAVGLPPVLARILTTRSDLATLSRHLERELLLACARAELSRGVRVLHLVLAEVLELGPRSLPWVDAAIATLWRRAQAVIHRDYELWVYSGHGLERPAQPVLPNAPEGLTLARGTLGHFYLRGGSLDRARANFLRQGVPLLAWRDGAQLRLQSRTQEWLAAELFAGRPEVARDLQRLCADPRAGELVLLGWAPDRSVSFGGPACGGPGPWETQGFVFLPSTAPFEDEPAAGVRALHRAAGSALAREPVARRLRALPRQGELRVMTYNVHACRGRDGRVSPARIARVIAEFLPDVVALQELDVGRPRSGHADQAQDIAEELQYSCRFQAAMELQEGHFGNALLSRLPLRLVQSGSLPRPKVPAEPRAALWVALDLAGREIQILNTHLGLLTAERLRQVEALLGPQWLEAPPCRGPVVLCGDLNAGRTSPELERLSRRLVDVQDHLPAPPRNTWFSARPVRRLDYILVSGHFRVEAVHIPRTSRVRAASDHLPLVADLRLLWP